MNDNNDDEITTLTSEQKLVLSKLYRNGRKVVKTRFFLFGTEL